MLRSEMGLGQHRTLNPVVFPVLSPLISALERGRGGLPTPAIDVKARFVRPDAVAEETKHRGLDSALLTRIDTGTASKHPERRSNVFHLAAGTSLALVRRGCLIPPNQYQKAPE
jgi:hypothetical protein